MTDTNKETLDIEGMLDSLVEGFNIEFDERTKKLFLDSNLDIDLVELKKQFDTGEYETICILTISQFSELKEGIVRILSADRDIQFILNNYNYVENLFEQVIKEKEDWSCCADKSRYLMKQLINHFKTGEMIKHNMQQKYTYHIPKSVFLTHDEIIEFYEAVKNLYYGGYDKFVNIINKYKGA